MEWNQVLLPTSQRSVLQSAPFLPLQMKGPSKKQNKSAGTRRYAKIFFKKSKPAPAPQAGAPKHKYIYIYLLMYVNIHTKTQSPAHKHNPDRLLGNVHTSFLTLKRENG